MTVQRREPVVLIILTRTVSVFASVLGVMSLASTRIEWRSYFGAVVSYYQETVTQPIKRSIAKYVDQIEQSLDVNLDWIVWFLPEYLPIASVFFFGLVVSACHVWSTTPFGIVSRWVRKIIDESRKEVGSPFETFIVGVLWIGFLFLFSPILFIAVPVLAIAVFLLGLLLLYGYVRFLGPYLLMVATVVWLIWLFLKPESCLASTRSRVVSIVNMICRLPAQLTEWIPNIYREARQELRENKSEIRKEIGQFRAFFYYQYAIALAIGLAFLLVFGVNEVI